ncbi:MAG: preprotein translocase subunit YajC [Nitrospira sp.]|nr:preprotein translocase subunit YajC [Nitrospira sp.]MDH4236502.1 preprotein translocase subunit YajC [Nitrospira sp.]
MLMESIAWAEGTGGGSAGTSSLLSFVPFVLIFVIFYFLLIRPQQKKQKEQKALLEAVKKGDKIVTTSGIWGTVTNLGKETVTLQIADNTKIKMQRENIARVRGEDEDKDKDKDKDA